MDKVQDLKARARTFETAGDDAGALRCYVEAAELGADRADPGLVARIGTLRLHLGETREAVESLAEASRLFEQAGLRNNALALCHRLLRADPERTEAYLRLGELSAELGYRQDARRGFMEYADRLEVAGDVDESERAVRAYLRYFPDDTSVRGRLGSPMDEPEPRRGAPDSVAADLAVVGNEPVDPPPIPDILPTIQESAATPQPDSGFAPLEGLEPTHAAPAWDPGASLLSEQQEEPQEEDVLPILGTGYEDDADPGVEEAAGDDPLPLLGDFGAAAEDEEEEPGSAPVEDAAVALRARITADPQDLGAHQSLVDHLAKHGSLPELEGGLEAAHQAAARAGEYGIAADLAARLAQIRPTDVGLVQSWAEYAFRSGDRQRLISAYLAVARRFVAAGQEEPARRIYERVLKLDPANQEARQGAGEPAQPQSEYVDLGAMILDDEEEESTRFRVEAEFPTGDEEHDFNEILSVFRQQISDKIDPTDSASHYDLGLAFKEMGLWDDAITQLQRALRAGANPLAALEVLGECYVEKGDHDTASRMLERALQLPQASPRDLVGVHYWLGRSEQGRGHTDAAHTQFGRVIEIDPGFRDAADRLQALRQS